MDPRLQNTFAAQAAKGEKFTVVDVDEAPALGEIALQYAKAYGGTFEFMVEMHETAINRGYLTAGQSKGVLNCMLADFKRGAKTSVAPAVEPPAGLHLVDGTVVKIQKGRESGRLFAKVLSIVPDPTAAKGKAGKWLYAGRRDPFGRCSTTTLMTADEAAKLGLETGVCVVCGRELTVKESIDRGIGPVCYSRLLKTTMSLALAEPLEADEESEPIDYDEMVPFA